MPDGAIGYAALSALVAADHLSIFGAFHPEPGDAAPVDCMTLLMLGPAEPGFWPAVSTAPEFADGAADPLDRWSVRVIGRIAEDIGAKALFPFGGPPYQPFIAWAARTGRAWPSPVGLLVHDRAGLMVSYRGALALPWLVDLPAVPARPCGDCAQPCLSACPVGALAGTGYDLPTCHAYLDTNAGADCLAAGCRVRRACPVSQSYGRMPEQSAFHMRAFQR